MPIYKVVQERILKNDPSMSSINLAASDLTDSDIVNTLIPLLRKNDYIVTIDFSQNSIGDAGAVAFANYAEERLEECKLNSNRKPFLKVIFDKNPEIQNVGGIALVQSPVSRLILSRTSVSEDTAIAAKKSQQIELNLSLNNIDRDLIKQVNEVIAKNYENSQQNKFRFGSSLITKFVPAKHEEEHKTADNTPNRSSTSSLSKSSDFD